MKISNKEGETVTSLDFGFVEIGKEHEFKYVLHNDSPYEVIDIAVSIADKNVRVEAPKTMEPNEKRELAFFWKPPLDQKKGLKTIFKIKRTEVYK